MRGKEIVRRTISIPGTIDAALQRVMKKKNSQDGPKIKNETEAILVGLIYWLKSEGERFDVEASDMDQEPKVQPKIPT